MNSEPKRPDSAFASFSDMPMPSKSSTATVFCALNKVPINRIRNFKYCFIRNLFLCNFLYS